MTTFPEPPAADKIAAMRERAKTEAEQYGQTTVPAMLLQGAAWGEEVAWWMEMAWRLRSYTVHDDNCSFNCPPHYAGCTCKLRDALTRMEIKDAEHKRAALQETAK